jgi:hypothetical protein
MVAEMPLSVAFIVAIEWISPKITGQTGLGHTEATLHGQVAAVWVSVVTGHDGHPRWYQKRNQGSLRWASQS